MYITKPIQYLIIKMISIVSLILLHYTKLIKHDKENGTIKSRETSIDDVTCNFK